MDETDHEKKTVLFARLFHAIFCDHITNCIKVAMGKRMIGAAFSILTRLGYDYNRGGGWSM